MTRKFLKISLNGAEIDPVTEKLKRSARSRSTLKIFVKGEFNIVNSLKFDLL